MPVTTDEILRHLRRRERRRREEVRSRAERLRHRLPAARRLLVDELGAERVVLFGSLASGNPDAASDVDLAVEGLPRGSFLEAAAELMRLFGTGVDLVRLEEAGEILREEIRAGGEEL